MNHHFRCMVLPSMLRLMELPGAESTSSLFTFRLQCYFRFRRFDVPQIPKATSSIQHSPKPSTSSSIVQQLLLQGSLLLRVLDNLLFDEHAFTLPHSIHITPRHVRSISLLAQIFQFFFSGRHPKWILIKYLVSGTPTSGLYTKQETEVRLTR